MRANNEPLAIQWDNAARALFRAVEQLTQNADRFAAEAKEIIRRMRQP